MMLSAIEVIAGPSRLYDSTLGWDGWSKALPHKVHYRGAEYGGLHDSLVTETKTLDYKAPNILVSTSSIIST